MKAPVAPLPTWLKWLMRIGGVFLLAPLLIRIPISGLLLYLYVRAFFSPGGSPKLDEKIMQALGELAGELIIAYIGIWLLRRSWKKPVDISEIEETSPAAAEPAAAATSARRTSKRWSVCNVFEAQKDVRHLWQFSARSFNLQREEEKLPNEPLSAKLVSKDWNTLFQPKLNVAWLPANSVFLRVLQLPPTDTPEETASMVELQLEKVSPLPTAQAVWTFESLPKRLGQPQTTIVVIAPRNLVEEYLGKLETDGYLADRLEVPFIDQLLSTKIQADGVWVFPGLGLDESNCLVAWWYGGTLQNVSLLHLPPTAEEQGPFLREQIAQMAWAGELEGWITSPPHRFLVTDAETAAVWQPMLQEGLQQHVEVIAPLPEAEVARLTARRAARENAPAGLVPPEFAARYRQQFVDRIWMRGVFGVALIYLFGVFIYLAFIQYLDMRVSKVEQDVRNLSLNYTNALRLKDQVRVMQDQLNLQFASLDCYRAVAEKIPEGVQLEGLNFQRGKTLAIYGNAPNDALPRLNEFSDQLRHATANGQLIFKNVATPSYTSRGSQLSWNFTAELAKGESD